MRKRAYRAISIKNVNVSELLSHLPEGPLWVGVDVAKSELLVAVLDSQGGLQRPWKVKQPSEIGLLIATLQALSAGRDVTVGMESTGTYGDCLRQALTDAEIVPHRVHAKAVKDHSETFDGVPSNHDGKDAAIIAELLWIGKSRPWPSLRPSEWQAQVEREVLWFESQQEILMLWLGRIEGLLARHWPELLTLLKLNSATLLHLVAEYGDPKAVAACSSAEQRLRGWGRIGLSEEKVRAVVESARQTVGVRMPRNTIQMLQQFAGEALKARREMKHAHRKLEVLGKENETTRRMGTVVGPVTACVLLICVGNPHAFHCGEAFRKAMGLNLRERSSGQYQGKLKITKRGSARARRWLYFSALRVIQRQPVKTWYFHKKNKDQGRGRGAIVGVMRKLALAVYAVTTRNEAFELQRLLPGKSWKPGQGQAVASGGSPPDPKDLARAGQKRR